MRKAKRSKPKKRNKFFKGKSHDDVNGYLITAIF